MSMLTGAASQSGMESAGGGGVANSHSGQGDDAGGEPGCLHMAGACDVVRNLHDAVVPLLRCIECHVLPGFLARAEELEETMKRVQARLAGMRHAQKSLDGDFQRRLQRIEHALRDARAVHRDASARAAANDAAAAGGV